MPGKIKSKNKWRKHDNYNPGLSFNRILTLSQVRFQKTEDNLENLNLFANSAQHELPGHPHLMNVMKGEYGNIPRTIITRSSAKYLSKCKALEERLMIYKSGSTDGALIQEQNSKAYQQVAPKNENGFISANNQGRTTYRTNATESREKRLSVYRRLLPPSKQALGNSSDAAKREGRMYKDPRLPPSKQALDNQPLVARDLPDEIGKNSSFSLSFATTENEQSRRISDMSSAKSSNEKQGEEQEEIIPSGASQRQEQTQEPSIFFDMQMDSKEESSPAQDLKSETQEFAKEPPSIPEIFTGKDTNSFLSQNNQEQNQQRDGQPYTASDLREVFGKDSTFSLSFAKPENGEVKRIADLPASKTSSAALGKEEQQTQDRKFPGGFSDSPADTDGKNQSIGQQEQKMSDFSIDSESKGPSESKDDFIQPSFTPQTTDEQSRSDSQSPSTSAVQETLPMESNSDQAADESQKSWLRNVYPEPPILYQNHFPSPKSGPRGTGPSDK